jgi:nitroreductase
MAVPFKKALLAEGIEPAEADEQVARSRDRLEAAPTAILLCLDSGELDTYQDARRDAGERIMGVQSVALSGGSLLLAAHAEGFGAVWVCAPLFVPEEVCFALDLPEEWEPQGVILLGLPQAIPKPRDRRPIEAVTRFL